MFDRMKIVAPDDETLQFLDQHQELIPYLEEASRRLSQIFPESNRFNLRLSFDPEIDDIPCLILSALTALEVGEARDRLDRFDAEWWVNLPDDIRRIFFVTVEYVSVQSRSAQR